MAQKNHTCNQYDHRFSLSAKLKTRLLPHTSEKSFLVISTIVFSQKPYLKLHTKLLMITKKHNR